MAAKKNFITVELDLAEQQLKAWERDLLANPYDEVEDRKELMKSKSGGAYYAVVQTREAIQKSLRDTLKDYIALSAEVKRLREVEETKKKSARGDDEVPEAMEE